MLSTYVEETITGVCCRHSSKSLHLSPSPKPTAFLEVISCLLVQLFDSQQTSRTLINLRVTSLVGVWELLLVMSLSTYAVLSVAQSHCQQ